MLPTIDELVNRLGFEPTDMQWAPARYLSLDSRMPNRVCLYFKTGAGKTVGALLALWEQKHETALVLAPPITHPKWREEAAKFGIKVDMISHAKFRQKDYKVDRTVPVIVDEFHMLGGVKGQGWRKMERLAQALLPPIILLSATPNYNDAERDYCVERILDPKGTQGGYLNWLYNNCNTRQNPFGATPLVDEDKPFRNRDNAAQALMMLPGVFTVEDDAEFTIVEHYLQKPHLPNLDKYGLIPGFDRLVASQMEERQLRNRLNYLNPPEQNLLRDEVLKWLEDFASVFEEKIIFYCNTRSVADALHKMMLSRLIRHSYIHGHLTQSQKEDTLEDFIVGPGNYLIGTASMATGTDGLDKVCSTLVLFQDTDDAALRRQILGRILPRGARDPDVWRPAPSFHRLNFS